MAIDKDTICSVCKQVPQASSTGKFYKCNCGNWVKSNTTAGDYVFEDAGSQKPSLRFLVKRYG